MAEGDVEIARSSDLRAKRPSSLNRDDLGRYFKREFQLDASHSSVWRQEARGFFDFIAGRQWTPDEQSQLRDQLRPEVVFNRAITIIKAVAGFEINSRHEIQFLPRNTQDTAVNELLSGASKWMAQDCDGEDEESEAFGHTLICGMGWNEHRMDYEQESSGKYIEEAISPYEMYWDRKAKKKNISDARRKYRLRRMSLLDAMDMFPGYDELQLDARWAVGLEPEQETKTLEEKRRREENTIDNMSDANEVHILHCQWWEREPFWLVADPTTNQKREMSVSQYEELQKRLKMMAKVLPDFVPPPYSSVKMMRRVYKQCFIGGEVLVPEDMGEDSNGVSDVMRGLIPGKDGGAPKPFDGFTWTCITGESDYNKGTWFGLVQIMKDPAKWSNKWLSQTMHIMNSQAKGGIMVEEDFAADIRKFEENYAKPEAVTKVKKGALSNANGPKFVAKPVGQFPQGFYQLLEFAITSLRDVTGINLELLGQQDQNQPGILEAQRKQAGMTVLATMFDSLRRARKFTGRIRLFMIQNYVSDGRIIRISGPDGVQALPLLRDNCLGEYDVTVDDTPSSPNQKEASWAIIAPMLPMFKDQLAAMPELLVAILEYSPLPNRLVELLKALLSKPNPQRDQAAQLATQKLVAAINKDQSTAEMQLAKAGSTQATATLDLAMAQHLLAKEAGTEGNPAQQHLDALHTAAQIGTETAKADQIRAATRKTHAEADHVGVMDVIDAQNMHADTLNKHADTHGKHIAAIIDALTPIPKAKPVGAA